MKGNAAMTILMHDLAGADPALRFSPYCWRTKLALAHKGLAVETTPWRFSDTAAIGFSGQGRVPVIRDGDRVVFDSWTIAAYLEAQYPDRPSLFNGPGGQSHARFINAWADTVLNAGIFPLIVQDLFQAIDPGDRAYFRASREQRLGGTTLEAAQAGREGRLAGFRASLTPLRTVLAAQPFLGGAGPSYADHIVAGSLMWPHCASRFALLATDDPVFAWWERMSDRYGGLMRAAKRV
jgi:glutathione S-transferase